MVEPAGTETAHPGGHRGHAGKPCSGKRFEHRPYGLSVLLCLLNDRSRELGIGEIDDKTMRSLQSGVQFEKSDYLLLIL